MLDSALRLRQTFGGPNPPRHSYWCVHGRALSRPTCPETSYYFSKFRPDYQSRPTFSIASRADGNGIHLSSGNGRTTSLLATFYQRRFYPSSSSYTSCNCLPSVTCLRLKSRSVLLRSKRLLVLRTLHRRNFLHFDVPRLSARPTSYS